MHISLIQPIILLFFKRKLHIAIFLYIVLSWDVVYFSRLSIIRELIDQPYQHI